MSIADIPEIPSSNDTTFASESAEIWPLVRHPTSGTDARVAPLDVGTHAYFVAGVEAARALASAVTLGGGDACLIASPTKASAGSGAPATSRFSVFAAAAAQSQGGVGRPWHPFSSCVMQAIDTLAESDRLRNAHFTVPYGDAATGTAGAAASSESEVPLEDQPAAGVKRGRLAWEGNPESDDSTYSGGALQASGAVRPTLDETSSAVELATLWRTGSAAAAVAAAPVAGCSLSDVCRAAWSRLPSTLPQPVLVVDIARELGDADSSVAPSKTARPHLAQRYLATGMDAFLTREPDAFEAMALVHSRVARVIYGAEDALRGALGSSQTPLHEVRALNHHYEVYRVGGGGGGEGAADASALRAT